MTRRRREMPNEAQLRKLRKLASTTVVPYNSRTHQLLLYAKFKKTAFTRDDWFAFHLQDIYYKKNISNNIQYLVVHKLLDCAIIDDTEYLQITKLGEHQLNHCADRERIKINRRNAKNGVDGWDTRSNNMQDSF